MVIQFVVTCRMRVGGISLCHLVSWQVTVRIDVWSAVTWIEIRKSGCLIQIAWISFMVVLMSC